MAKKITVLCKEYWIKKGFSEEEAITKSRGYSCWCKEYWIKKGFSEVEASIKIKEKQLSNNHKVDQQNKAKPYEKIIKDFINNGLTEKDSLLIIDNLKKEKSQWCKEYWIKRGFDIKDIDDIIHKIQTVNAQKVDQKNKLNPYELQNWLNRGLSENEANEKIQQIKDSQNIYKNFPKDKLNNVLKKRSDTYYLKTKEERIKINKSRGKTKEQLIIKFGKELADKICLERGSGRRNSFFKRYSKTSEKFFNELQNNINEKIFYGKEEKWIRYNHNKGFYIDCLKDKKIIEFNGDFYHANPKLYEFDSLIKIAKNNIKTAKQIWKKDEFKIKTLKKLGYEILIIWELDIFKNKETVLKECINFLKNE